MEFDVLHEREALKLILQGSGPWNDFFKENENTHIKLDNIDFDLEKLKEKYVNDTEITELLNLARSISFSHFIFNDKTTFTKSNFYSYANFQHTQFRGDVNFQGVTFHKCVNFRGATFSGTTFFNKAIFKSKLDCSNAVFEKDLNLMLEDDSASKDIASSQPREIVFYKAIFNESVHFDNTNKEGVRVDKLSFQGASFAKILELKGDFDCVPDLRLTKTSHHVDLSQLNVKLRRTAKICCFRKPVETEDAECLCRLKEIAESNKNHKKALAFHADEQRARRWGELNSLQSLLDKLFSITSNYGQSILKPFCLLLISISLFVLFNWVQTNDSKLKHRFAKSLTLSVALSTPFISLSKGTKQEAQKSLYPDGVPDYYTLFGYTHSGVSYLSIFLFGLGLRNRFKL